MVELTTESCCPRRSEKTWCRKGRYVRSLFNQALPNNQSPRLKELVTLAAFPKKEKKRKKRMAGFLMSFQ